jgi:hypothetical protein
MANIQHFRAFTNNKERRRSFYCYCTTLRTQDQAVFFLLVEAYRAARRKRQAIFINNWFIKGEIPAILDAGGYLSKVNIQSAVEKQISSLTADSVAAIGQTFADKIKVNGGGISGFFGAIAQKTADNKPPQELFEAAEREVVGMLNGNDNDFGNAQGTGGKFVPDHFYQPYGGFAAQVLIFKGHLKTAGFDPDDLGIY